MRSTFGPNSSRMVGETGLIFLVERVRARVEERTGWRSLRILFPPWSWLHLSPLLSFPPTSIPVRTLSRLFLHHWPLFSLQPPSPTPLFNLYLISFFPLILFLLPSVERHTPRSLKIAHQDYRESIGAGGRRRSRGSQRSSDAITWMYITVSKSSLILSSLTVYSFH